MLLPQPPDHVEKYLYVNQNKKFLYVWGAISYVALLTGMTLFSLTHEWTILFLLFTVLTGFYLGLSYFIGLFAKPFRPTDSVSLRYLPSIDVLLPTCGEPLEILENTYKYVAQLRYPKELLRIHVLDDALRLSVASLADRFNFNYISRGRLGELKKAGNLRYAFTRTEGEWFLVLDADFVPREDMLISMLPYIRDDAAIVQSPQFFRINKDQPWIMKGAAYIQELFYRLIQVNRDNWGASICVGTCALYRRKALEPHGGTYPIAYSEDLHTGFQALCDGWKVKYIPVNLSAGLCPDSMSSFFTQQMRWCTGSSSLLFNKDFWLSPLTVMQKLCYLSGMLYYIATSLMLILSPLPGLIVTWFFPEKVFWYNYLLSLPSFLFSLIILAMWGRLPFGLYVPKARLVSYYAHVFALYNKLRNSVEAWIPSGDSSRTRTLTYSKFKTLMFAWTTFVSGAAIIGAAVHMTSPLDFNFYPLLFFTSFNYYIAMTCFVEEA